MWCELWKPFKRVKDFEAKGVPRSEEIKELTNQMAFLWWGKLLLFKGGCTDIKLEYGVHIPEDEHHAKTMEVFDEWHDNFRDQQSVAEMAGEEPDDEPQP